MLNRIRKEKEGFTIIEVLIVLAIAGLIILIVLLAVPALQRNARNTAIKSDVGNVLSGITEFTGANNGSMPTTLAQSADTITYSRTGGNSTIAKVQGSTTVSTTTAAPGTAPALGTIQVRLGANCSGTTNTRSAAAYYSIETGGSGTATQQCQDV